MEVNQADQAGRGDENEASKVLVDRIKGLLKNVDGAHVVSGQI